MSFRAAFAPLRRATTQMQMKSVGSVRNMGSAGATIEEEIAEMNKWKKITALAVPGCMGFAYYTFSNASHHGAHEQPGFSYLKMNAKRFPWGNGTCGLFEFKEGC